MVLNGLCEEIVQSTHGCLGCAVVDLDTGLPLAWAVHPDSPIDSAAMEAMSVASVPHFRGRTIWQLELELAGAGKSQAGFVHEIQTTTMDSHHFMSLVPDMADTLLILITSRSASLGMGWVALRQALERIRTLHAEETGEAPAAPAHRRRRPHRRPRRAPSRSRSCPIRNGAAGGDGECGAAAPPSSDEADLDHGPPIRGLALITAQCAPGASRPKRSRWGAGAP